ncbi:F-box/LRR-repeat protein [Trifolium pratense]|uniref:F-box/LRR-repeat protein n=1 Tax=Trifolium pratense TaxID=57577 RepID=A0A2K3K7W4_TRIPR|nr:F-box/LRR-repeat protein [Trifolium pratense]
MSEDNSNTSNIGVTIPHDFGTTSNDKDSSSSRIPLFSGNSTKFSWWKRKMKSHVIGIDEVLWEIVNGVDFVVDSDGMDVDRPNIEVARFTVPLSLS